MSPTHSATAPPRFGIWFESLFDEGRGLVFPCDERGHVDIDALSERARSNYFFARAMLGREYAAPQVIPCGPCGFEAILRHTFDHACLPRKVPIRG